MEKLPRCTACTITPPNTSSPTCTCSATTKRTRLRARGSSIVRTVLAWYTSHPPRPDNAKTAGIYTFYAFLTHIENCKLYGNRIGIHSGSTNLRVIASDFASSDITAILIDAGNAIEIDGCCIEGNSGTAIIVSGGPRCPVRRCRHQQLLRGETESNNVMLYSSC